MNVFRRSCAGLLGVAALVLSAGAQASSVNGFTSFWVTGDSLSDPGNLFEATGGTDPPSPPYFEGRFSNGPVWAEYIAGDFEAQGLDTDNFAYGGARALPDGVDPVPDLPTQIGLLGAASAGNLGARPLASMWFGANDLFFEGVPFGNAAEVGRQAARAVGAGALQLQALGFNDVLLFNLPNLAETPRYALFGTPEEQQQARRGSRAFNRTLERQTGRLESAGMNVIGMDMNVLFAEMIADPQKFGVQNATIPCLIPGQPPCSAAEALALAFFDPVHVNSVIHEAIADVVRSEVAPVPLPLPAALLAAGLGVLALVRRRSTRGRESDAGTAARA